MIPGEMAAPPALVGEGAPPRRAVRQSHRSMPPVASHSPATSPAPISPAPTSSASAAQSTALRPVTAEAAAQGVEQGVGSFAKPDPMTVNQWTTIKFFVGLAEQDVREQSAGAALSEPAAVYVAKAMRVRLSPNPSFEIKPTSDEAQLTGTMGKTATWSWQVRPIDDRSDKLEAEIKVYALNPDNSFGSTITGYSKRVKVEVRISAADRTHDRIKTATALGSDLTGLFGTWQKTIAALVALLGALGLLAWKLGLRKSKPE